MELLLVILSAAVLAASLSIDAFAAAFAYGCSRIKIPMRSVHIINLICTSIISAAFLLGAALSRFMPEDFAAWLSFSILLFIGVIKLFDSISKNIILKHTDFSKEVRLSLFSFKLILHLYADPEAADADVSKSISPREAAVLALSLSLDGIAVGFGAALAGVNGWAVAVFSLVINFVALVAGSALGNRAANKLKFNISWLAGVILIGLAIEKIL